MSVTPVVLLLIVFWYLQIPIYIIGTLWLVDKLVHT